MTRNRKKVSHSAPLTRGASSFSGKCRTRESVTHRFGGDVHVCYSPTLPVSGDTRRGAQHHCQINASIGRDAGLKSLLLLGLEPDVFTGSVSSNVSAWTPR